MNREQIINKVLEDHKKLFAKLNKKAQTKKLGEEIVELINTRTRDDFIEELADCLICSIGLLRFDRQKGEYFIDSLFFKGKLAQLSEQTILEAIIDKMEINKSRKWTCRDNYYKHY